MTEICPKDHRDIGWHFILDNVCDGFNNQSTTIIEPSKDNAFDCVRTLDLQKRFQIAVKLKAEIVAHDIVIFQKQHLITDVWHIWGSLQQIQRTKIAADDCPLTSTFLDGVIFRRRFRGCNHDGSIFHHTIEKCFAGVFSFSIEGECAIVWTMVSDKPSFGIDSIMQGSDIRKSAKDLWVLRNQIIVKMTQELIAIKAAQAGNDHLYIWVGKCFMDVLNP